MLICLIKKWAKIPISEARKVSNSSSNLMNGKVGITRTICKSKIWMDELGKRHSSDQLRFCLYEKSIWKVSKISKVLSLIPDNLITLPHSNEKFQIALEFQLFQTVFQLLRNLIFWIQSDQFQISLMSKWNCKLLMGTIKTENLTLQRSMNLTDRLLEIFEKSIKRSWIT